MSDNKSRTMRTVPLLPYSEALLEKLKDTGLFGDEDEVIESRIIECALSSLDGKVERMMREEWMKNHGRA